MELRELTTAQLAALQAKLQPMHDYLHRLRARMARQGFAGGDPLVSACQPQTTPRRTKTTLCRLTRARPERPSVK
jgi:hypothetical protein